MGIFFQLELPGIFTPSDDTGHPPPPPLATPWSDSGRANTDSSQPPRSIELPTHSKTAWWEKGKAPLGLPCALREDCRCISKLGHSGQAGAAKDPLDRDGQREGHPGVGTAAQYGNNGLGVILQDMLFWLRKKDLKR